MSSSPHAHKVVVAVGSTNPCKLQCVEYGFLRAFNRPIPIHQSDTTSGQDSTPARDTTVTVHGISVPSGVSPQPMSNRETRIGAENRARCAYLEYYRTHGQHADYAVGIEGGLGQEDGDDYKQLFCFGWVVVFNGRDIGSSRSASFLLPPAVSLLVHSGVELSAADDMVFGRANSGQGEGTVGFLTSGAITRADFYESSVVLALVPFCSRAELYL